MKENNILYHYNEETELSIPEASFKEEHEAKLKKEQLDNKKESRDIIHWLLVPKKDELNIKENMIAYIVLLIYFILLIINTLLRKEFIYLIGIIPLTYITVQISSKIYKFQNTRYMHIATWNLYSSLTMIVKASMYEFTESINYVKFISYTTTIYIISLVLGIIPSFSFLSMVALIALIYSFIIAFYNRDFEIIKESCGFLNKISPIIIIAGSIMGSIFFGAGSVNMIGYVVWLAIYMINATIEEYNFEEM